jgi:hypothetical protein
MCSLRSLINLFFIKNTSTFKFTMNYTHIQKNTVIFCTNVRISKNQVRTVFYGTGLDQQLKIYNHLCLWY